MWSWGTGRWCSTWRWLRGRWTRSISLRLPDLEDFVDIEGDFGADGIGQRDDLAGGVGAAVRVLVPGGIGQDVEALVLAVDDDVHGDLGFGIGGDLGEEIARPVAGGDFQD